MNKYEEQLDNRFPSCPVWVNGHFVTLHEDGTVQLYSDGDVKLTLSELKEITTLEGRFVWMRENEASTA